MRKQIHGRDTCLTLTLTLTLTLALTLTLTLNLTQANTWKGHVEGVTWKGPSHGVCETCMLRF